MNFKKFKRLLSLTLSAAMVLSTNVTGFAAEITSPDSDIAAQADESHQHTWGTWETILAPTCTVEGVEGRSCTSSTCWEMETKVTSPLKHSYDETAEDYDDFEHTEEVEWEITKSATCKEFGEKTLTCQRDGCSEEDPTHTKKIELPKEEHIWNDTVTSVPETCTKAGLSAKFCKFGCGEYDPASKVEGSPAKGHSWQADVPDISELTVEQLNTMTSNADKGITVQHATCQASGSIVLECQREDCDGEDEDKNQEKTFPAIKHTFGDIDPETLTNAELQALTTKLGIAVTSATCTQDGSVIFTCTNGECEYKDGVTKTIPMLGHAIESYNVSQAPTCKQPGEKTGTCTRCSAPVTEAVPATGHSYGTIDLESLTPDQVAAMESDAQKGITVQKPTCTAGGKVTIECKNTGCDGEAAEKNAEKTVSALGHDFNDGEILQGDEATCTEAGTKTFTCQREDCDEGEDEDGHGSTYTEPVTALGHTYGNIAVKEDNTIEAKDLVGITSNAEKGIAITAANCTTEGKLTLTCKRTGCGEYNVSKDYRILKAGHNWENTTYRVMSCDTNTTGMILKECQNEGCNTSEWEMVPVKHDYELEDWEATEDNTQKGENATCTTSGTVFPVCQVCKEGATGHVGTAITVPALGHTFAAEGYTWPDSDKAQQSDLDTLEIEDTAYKAPTCTQQGHQYYKCTRCTAVRSKSIGTTQHNYQSTTIPATCTQHSKTGEFCTNCKGQKPDTTVTEGTEELSGHNTLTAKQKATADQLREANITEEVESDATCTEDGHVYYICSNQNCDKTEGYLKRETIDSSGHDLEHKEIKATCTRGTQFVDDCKVCDYVLVRKTEQDQLDHKYDKIIQVVDKPNCKEGKTGITLFGCSNGDCGTTQFSITPATHDLRDATADDFAPDGNYEYEGEDDAPSKAASCGKDGYKYKICQTCGELERETLDALEHNYSQKASEEVSAPSDINGEPLEKAATCSTAGHIYYYCTNNGCDKADPDHYKKETISIDPDAHKQITGDIPATCLEPEKTGTYCEYCGEVMGDATEKPDGSPAKGHVYEREEGDIDTAKLRPATAEELTKENITEAIEDAATCLEGGYKYYACPDCDAGTEGHVVKVDIEAAGHTFSWNIHDADCLNPGRIEVTCENCNYENISEIPDQPPLGHKPVVYPAVAATCHDTGLTEGHGCERCQTMDVEQEIIPIDPQNHVWEDDLNDPANKEPDCVNETAGLEVYRCTYHPTVKDYRVIPGVHQWKTPEIQYCVNMSKMPGLIYHECSLCSKTEIMQMLTDCEICTSTEHQDDAKPYVVVKPNTIAAKPSTCTVAGSTEGKQCPLCNEWFVEPQPLNKLDHEGDWEVTSEGDCGTPGTRQRRCNTCKDLYGTIEQFQNTKEHTWSAETKNATCTEPMQARRICSVCETTTEWANIAGSKPLGHDWGSNDLCSRCEHYRVEISTNTTAADGKVSLTATGKIYDDKGFELVELGILYATTSRLATMNEEDAKSLLDYGSTDTACKRFSISEQNWDGVRVNINVGTQLDRKIAARAYVVIRPVGGEETRVIYGDVKLTTYNSIINTAK